MAEARESLIFMEEFDFHKCLKLLVEGHNSGHFGTALRRHLKDFVPAVFKNPGEPDPLVENRLSQKLIFNLFNQFICGDGDPDEVFKELKRLESPAALCAKVFKLGEPTYSCRDCGMDPTCVLCVECFQNSAHKHHKYKMSTSSGGGYCDCGDSEAWKSEPFCDIHRPGQAQGDNMESPSGLLKPDMISRLESLFVHLTDYMLEVILWHDPVELPQDLQCPVAPKGWMSVFITMLFNDEVHSYEQVTSALTKAINCSQTTAIDLATTVDREGKSIVKIGSKSECEHVKRVIEQATSRRIYNMSLEGTPLLVRVMSPFVVAHHSFAMKAIQWLRQLLNTYGVLRELYSEVALRPLREDSSSFVELCMLNETKMWKSARIQTRQLFLTGIFMNPSLKREFAITYTKVYDQVVDAYIKDDHDHSYSVTSESVQMFTVPSLARMLITEHNLLKVILGTLYKECALKVKENSAVMSFENQESNMKFSRIYSAIYDLKYALLVKPEPHEWSDKLRTNFLEGFRVFTDILKLMQGMDANLRQVDAHIEYEQEWETGFNFQLRLVEVYSMVVEWCKSDSQVLVECIHLLIKAVKSRSNKNKQVESARIAGWSSDCFRMDFTTDSVSIHSPLTRLLSSLLSCHNSLPFSFTSQLLETLAAQEETSIKELLEPCLKAVVFVGQVNAGMWRRNGFSLQSQVYFYHNIKCRSTMFDKDLLFLQIAASVTPSNDFLVQFVHSFGLINWSKTEYDTESTPDDSMKHVISLAETFLNWLINIYCERYTIGVGEVTDSDIQKYEIVHCLCIQPMSHSELLDSISCNSNSEKEKCLEELVKEVATFKKPSSGTGKGLYELKDEFYAYYNPYFYHYTKSNRAKSEETVKKYLRSRELSPVIQPPSAPLPEFVGMFRNIPGLLRSDVFLHVVRLVLTRSTARWSKSWSEMQLEKVLFLMEFAVREEEKRREQGEVDLEFVRKAMDGSSLPLSVVQIMENLLAHPPFAQNSLRDMMASIHERTLALAQGGQTKMEEGSDTTSSSQSSIKDGKKSLKTTEKAKKRREKIMAQMAKMQRNFIKENQELFESTSTRNSISSSMDQSSMDESLALSADVPMTHPVALGLRKSPAVASVGRQTCILCQEDQEVLHNEKALVYCTYMQKSTVLSTDRNKQLDLKVAQGTDPLFADVTLNFGLHTSTCGHVMHADCWKSFFESLKQRENRRVTRHSFNVKRDEFLCPMCETISNTVLPLVSPLALVASKESDEKKVDLSLDEWLDGILKTVENSIRQEKDRESRDESFFLVPCPLSTVTKMMAEGVAQRFQYIFDYIADDNSSAFSDSIVDMLKKFSVDAFKESLDADGGDDNRVPVTLWNTCSHTILSAENLLRFDDKPLFGSLPSKQAECMGNLIRLAAVSSNFFPVEAIKKHCIRLLSVLVCRSADPHDPDLMNFDLFHALVSVCLSLPTLYREGGSDPGRTIVVPTGHVNESNLLQLVLSCHLLQIFLAIEARTEEEARLQGDPMETEESSNSSELLEICQQFRLSAGLPPTTMDSMTLLRHVNLSCLPFLRSSALFFHYLTGVPVPLELFQKSGDELDSICEYLDLPCDFSRLFDKSKLLRNILSGWCKELTVNPDTPSGTLRGGRWHAAGQSTSEASSECPSITKVRFPRKVNQLLDLPLNYSDLINQSSMFACPKSNSSDESKTPALCLVCGKTVCSQSYCCQVKFEPRRTVGAAMAHAYTCCGGVGIFLRVRDCQIMLIAGIDKACFIPPPYLDEYGETDEGLRRGNPLMLCQERYKNLQRMWLNHSIAMELVHRVENPIHPQVLMSPMDINHL